MSVNPYAIVFTAVAISTFLRIYVRASLVRNVGWDDIFMIIASCIYVTFCAMSVNAFRWGYGQHQSTLTNEQIRMALLFWYLCQVTYGIGLLAARISIGFFLRRFLLGAVHKWIVRLALAIAISFGIVYVLMAAVQCTPVNYFWDRAKPGSIKGSCHESSIMVPLAYSTGAAGIITDFALTAVPIQIVWGLNVCRKTKAGLVIVLAMGCSASVAVCVEMFYIHKFKDSGFLYATTPLGYWAAVEYGMAIVAGNLATMRPLFLQLSRKFEPAWANKGHVPIPKLKMPKRIKTVPHGIDSHARRSIHRNSVQRAAARLSVKGGDHDPEFGMGKLRPVRLKDEDSIHEEHSVSKSEKERPSWRSSGEKVADEENQVGEITKTTEIRLSR